jgi:hypothetical protein
VLQLFSDNPWLLVVCLALLIPICGIVFGTTTSYLYKVRKAELQAALVQQMLDRGMSAEEICTVLEASPKLAARRLKKESAHCRH